MNSKFKSIIGSVVIGGLLLTTGSTTFANSTSTSADQSTTASQASSMTSGKMRGAMRGGMQNHKGFMGQTGMFFGQDAMQKLTENLVKEGIITQDIADSMISYSKEKDTERKTEMDKVKNMTADERKAYFESNKDTVRAGKSDIMSEMVTDKILTQDQANAVKNFISAQEQAKRQESLKKKYDSLVKDGIISQDVEDSIISFINQKDTERKAEMDKVKNMTADERKAYLESNKDAKKTGKTDQLSEMVSANILTQDQADAINKYFDSQAQSKRQESLKKQLDSLVSGNTITQDLEDKIITYLQQQNVNRKAEMEKTKSMTSEERTQYFANLKESSKDPLAQLVEQGILTQTQADAVSKVLFSQHRRAGYTRDSKTGTENN